MKNRRLLFRVILKIMFASGLFVLVLVFFNSLFTNAGVQNTVTDTNKNNIKVTIDISNIRKGQIKRVRWGAKEVAVLYRQFSKQAEQTGHSFEQNLHASLSASTRSYNPEYFVFINHGDSGNCPLYYAQGEFNDTCTKNIFDENGLPVFPAKVNYQIQIPPHYFEGETVHVGKWK